MNAPAISQPLGSLAWYVGQLSTITSASPAALFREAASLFAIDLDRNNQLPSLDDMALYMSTEMARLGIAQPEGAAA